jgi:hypothetical protein
VGYDTGQFLWFLLHTLIVFLSARALWGVYGGDAGKSRWSWLAVLTFAPAYLVLFLGQIGPIMLLGLIGFLFAIKNRRPSLTAAIVLTSLKPHLLYLIWLALVLWIVKERRWRLAFGLALSGVAVFALPLVLDPAIYFQYVQLFSQSGIVHPFEWGTPSLANLLSELFRFPSPWFRWLPMCAGALWCIWYWRRHSAHWDWLDRLPLILLVSVTTTSFVWTFDLIVLLPAVIQAAVWLTKHPMPGRRKAIFAGYLALNALLLAGKFFIHNDFWYFWAAPAYLGLYATLRPTIHGRIQQRRINPFASFAGCVVVALYGCAPMIDAAVGSVDRDRVRGSCSLDYEYEPRTGISVRIA